MRKRGEEVGRGDFRVEEDLGRKEALVADVDLVLLRSKPASADGASHPAPDRETHLARDRVLALVHAKVLAGLLVVLRKLLDHVATDVAVVLLDLLGDAKRVLGRDRVLSSVTKELLDERRDVATGDGDVLDRGSDDVALGLGTRTMSALAPSSRLEDAETHDWDNVSDSVSRVNDGPGQRAVGDLGAAPARGEREDGLDGDVESLDVERLEHDLRRRLAVLGRVERRLRLWGRVSPGRVRPTGGLTRRK